MRRSVLGAVLAVVVLAGCSESEPAEEATADETGTASSETTGGAADSVVEEFAGEDWFLGTVPDAPVPADPDADPIHIGMINQEDTPLGSFPELRRATEATVDFVNEELGGVGGRPIELHTCVVSFNVEQSQACAQEMVQRGVVALSGGIDVTSNGSIPVLTENQIPQIGGIPANLIEQRSEMTFFFSGGTTGAVAAFLAHAADEGADDAVIGYGEFESFDVTAEDYGVPVGESLGLDVETAVFPVTATDFLPILTGIADTDPDAIVMLVAGSSCVPLVETYRDLGIEAQLYLVGACAADEIVDAAGDDMDGVILNSEGRVAGEDDADVEGGIFDAINERYADGEGSGSGTLGVRSMLNLYSLMAEIGPEEVSSETIVELVRASDDRPSFWGFPYTCDGEQIAGLPALCAPQQVLFSVNGVNDFDQVGRESYDTVALYAAAG